MSLRQRQPRVADQKFLAFVRTKPCCACGVTVLVQAAHIRMSSAAHGTINPGVGAKPSDHLAVPLCIECHMDAPWAQHRVGERKFWERAGIDPFAVSQRLYAEFQASRTKP